jgi:hypothetical protein
MTDAKALKKMNGMSKAEGCKFAKLGVDQKFFVGNMKIIDKDGTLDVPVSILQTVADEFRSRAPDTSLMLITVSQTVARVFISIPESRTEITSDEWLASTSMEGEFEKHMADGEYLKFRDALVNEAFTFLKSKDLLEDEESEDECYTFDD